MGAFALVLTSLPTTATAAVTGNSFTVNTTFVTNAGSAVGTMRWNLAEPNFTGFIK